VSTFRISGKSYENTNKVPFNSNTFLVFVLFQCFGILKNARDEILRKWSGGGTAHLRTFRGSIVSKKMRFIGSNASFSLMICTWYKPVVSKLVQWKSHLQKTKNTSELQNQLVVSTQIR